MDAETRSTLRASQSLNPATLGGMCTIRGYGLELRALLDREFPLRPCFDQMSDDELALMLLLANGRLRQSSGFVFGRGRISAVELNLHRLLFISSVIIVDTVWQMADVDDEAWRVWLSTISRCISRAAEDLSDRHRRCLRYHECVTWAIREVSRRVRGHCQQYTALDQLVLHRCSGFSQRNGPVYNLAWGVESDGVDEIMGPVEAAVVVVRVPRAHTPPLLTASFDDLAAWERRAHLQTHVATRDGGELIHLPTNGMCFGPGMNRCNVSLMFQYNFVASSESAILKHLVQRNWPDNNY